MMRETKFKIEIDISKILLLEIYPVYNGNTRLSYHVLGKPAHTSDNNVNNINNSII